MTTVLDFNQTKNFRDIRDELSYSIQFSENTYATEDCIRKHHMNYF